MCKKRWTERVCQPAAGPLLVMLAGFAAGCDDAEATAASDASLSKPADGGAFDRYGDLDEPSEAASAPAAKIDFVFMIDNSGSTFEEQQMLAAGFPNLFSELTNALGRAPDLHIGVISSDVGAGPTPIGSSCVPGGDRGAFVARAQCGLRAEQDGWFLTIDANGRTNFESAGGAAKLADVFRCMVSLGSSGCGYEHQLASLYFALDGRTNPATNLNFLRDDALLAVVLLSDEDDCSALPNADFFAASIPGQGASFRCATKGHVCDGKPVAAAPLSTPLGNCTPAVQPGPAPSPSHLIDVDVFVDFVKQLKRGRDDRVFVGAIVGWDDSPSTRYLVEARPGPAGGTEINLGPICSDPATGEAAPALRLHAFATAFANHSVDSICTPDLKPAMAAIGRKLAALAR